LLPFIIYRKKSFGQDNHSQVFYFPVTWFMLGVRGLLT